MLSMNREGDQSEMQGKLFHRRTWNAKVKILKFAVGAGTTDATQFGV